MQYEHAARQRSEDAKVVNQMEVLSRIKLENSPELYKIVDVLNRTLKHRDLIFGLALDKEDEKQAVFTIYRACGDETDEKMDLD